MLYDTPQDRECREALDALLRSATFERSERLRKFLGFVCGLVLDGKTEEINEYRIGIEVFGRREDYSPSEDSIVRRQAHALRKKLEEYYQGEGRVSAIRIELPLGHYTAVFRRLEQHVPEAPAVVPAVVPVRSRFRTSVYAGAALFLLALGVLAGRYSAGTSQPGRMPAAMQWLWRPWLNDSSGTTLCLTNPKTMVLKYYPDSHPDSESEQLIPANSERSRTLRAFFNLQPGGELREYPSVGQAKMGEAVAAIRLTSLLASHGTPVRVEQSSFLEWNKARSENLIVFGHSESTPWADRLIEGYPLRTQSSQGALPKRITVSDPRAGEQPVYGLNESDPSKLYVLISMVPGVDGEHRLLSIAGLTGMATQYGAEFLTTPQHVEQLAAALRTAGAKTDRPPSFQAVLEVEVQENTVPLRGHIETVRLVEAPPPRHAPALARATPR